MAHIKVWCEYDFGGDFGCNNEAVFSIAEDAEDVVDEMVLALLKYRTGCTEEDLEDLYGWEYIRVEELGGK